MRPLNLVATQSDSLRIFFRARFRAKTWLSAEFAHTMHPEQDRSGESSSGAVAPHQRLNLVIDFKSHWRSTGLASGFVQPTVQTCRFELIGPQALRARNYQIPRVVPRHEERCDLTLLAFRADRRCCQKPRDFAGKLLQRVATLLQEDVRHDRQRLAKRVQAIQPVRCRKTRIGEGGRMATQLCQKCKQVHPGRFCDYDEKAECAETIAVDEVAQPCNEPSKEEKG